MKKLLKNISIVVIVLVLFTEYFTARATYAQGSQTYKTSVGRKEELKGLYPGYRVVDGKYDSDTTYEEFCKAIEAHEDAIIIYHGTENVVSDKNKFDAISDFQFFWLDRWTYCVGSDYVKVNISYLFDACETKKIKEQIDIIYSDIQYDITCTTDKSPWSAARYVYNYLTRTVTYDLNAGPHIRNIYGALIERRAVCKGYTAAFDYIMSRMGYQVGVAGNDKHIWNYMYWNSDDCFIDVTWGDPDCWDVYGNPYIDYSYMGLNVCELLTLKDHSIHYCYISGRGFYGSEVGSEYFYGIYENLYREAFPFDCAMLDRPFFIPGNGEMKLQFFNVSDLCRFIEIIIEKHPENHIFNVGNREIITVKEWVELCYKLAGSKAELISVSKDIFQREYFCFHDYEYVLDVSKQSELMPETIPLEDGLREEYEWYKDNKDSVYFRRNYIEYIDDNIRKVN